ncbi:MAG TPA: hypothetical protein VG710_08080 [Opitutus sp.]|nr:hypothetical protein [Opitutus sp.]
MKSFAHATWSFVVAPNSFSCATKSFMATSWSDLTALRSFPMRDFVFVNASTYLVGRGDIFSPHAVALFASDFLSFAGWRTFCVRNFVDGTRGHARLKGARKSHRRRILPQLPVLIRAIHGQLISNHLSGLLIVVR